MNRLLKALEQNAKEIAKFKMVVIESGNTILQLENDLEQERTQSSDTITQLQDDLKEERTESANTIEDLENRLKASKRTISKYIAKNRKTNAESQKGNKLVKKQVREQPVSERPNEQLDEELGQQKSLTSTETQSMEDGDKLDRSFDLSIDDSDLSSTSLPDLLELLEAGWQTEEEMTFEVRPPSSLHELALNENKRKRSTTNTNKGQLTKTQKVKI
ncbi:MAG: hypothetical protein M1813_002801 [Trichoglossum hirsutum]|nr:MAG: hypothetical protein M1813_002801 [Trichoglossum hirsutum]